MLTLMLTLMLTGAVLCNYALLLNAHCKDHDGAQFMYETALHHEPNHPTTLRFSRTQARSGLGMLRCTAMVGLRLWLVCGYGYRWFTANLHSFVYLHSLYPAPYTLQA